MSMVYILTCYDILFTQEADDFIHLCITTCKF